MVAPPGLDQRGAGHLAAGDWVSEDWAGEEGDGLWQSLKFLEGRFREVIGSVEREGGRLSPGRAGHLPEGPCVSVSPSSLEASPLPLCPQPAVTAGPQEQSQDPALRSQQLSRGRRHRSQWFPRWAGVLGEQGAGCAWGGCSAHIHWGSLKEHLPSAL